MKEIKEKPIKLQLMGLYGTFLSKKFKLKSKNDKISN